MSTTVKGKRPVNILYGADERPPLSSSLPVVLQQVVFLSLDLIYPVIIVAAIMGSSQLTQSVISLSMLAMGVGTIMQSLHKGSVGSGYFCPQQPTVLYLPASLSAVQTGGFPLLLGMTALAGLAEVAIAKIIHKVRFMFPTEIAGLLVVMMGFTLIPISVGLVSGSTPQGGPVDTKAMTLGFMTLGLIVMLSVWGTGRLRQYSIIIGIVFGHGAAYSMGLLTDESLNRVSQAPLFALPNISHIGWSFDAGLILPFLVAAVCSAIKTIGNVTVCQKADNPDWKRPDMRSVEGGLVAEGLSTMVAGLIGGMGQSSSSVGVGLNIATGIISRIIGFFVGAAFLVIAFMPKVAALFTMMPKPVIGAMLIISAIFVLVSGFQIIMSRMLDTRKTFIVGLTLVFGISVDILPGLYQNVSGDLKALFASSFSLATVIALVTNLVFRLGVRQSRTIEVEPAAATADRIFDFLEGAGASWGARRDIITRSIAVVIEFMESAAALQLVEGSAKVTAAFDEFNLNIDIYYRGTEMEFPLSRPSPQELLDDDRAFIRLSGYMIRQHADKVQSDSNGGLHHVRFHFEH